MWTEAHRARHEARPESVASLEAVGQVAAWPGCPLTETVRVLATLRHWTAEPFNPVAK